jgi:hypothetical protein
MLLALLLLADTAPFIAEVPPDAVASEEPPARTAEASCSVAAGTIGERHIEVAARTLRDGVGFALGAVEMGGPGSAQRQELMAGVSLGVFKAEARFVPWSSGLLRVSGEAGVHFDTLGLILVGHTASIGKTSMQAAGARVEYENSFDEQWHYGASAGASALSLDAPKSKDAWGAYSKSTLDWVSRWDVSAWVSRDLGSFSLSPSASVAQPPQDGAFEIRGALALEIQLGAAKIRAESGVARLWPDQVLFDVSAGVTMQLY